MTVNGSQSDLTDSMRLSPLSGENTEGKGQYKLT